MAPGAAVYCIYTAAVAKVLLTTVAFYHAATIALIGSMERVRGERVGGRGEEGRKGEKSYTVEPL